MEAHGFFDELADALDAERRIETHVSHLYFRGGRVLKLKKPVDLGFIDATTLERRRHFCDEEVRLNRRLAPDVYEGVAPVVRGEDGRLRLGEVGERPSDALEWAVVMRELPADRMLAELVERGEVDAALLDRLSELLADFHAGAESGPDIDAYGSLEAVAEHVRGNFATLAEHEGTAVSAALLARLRTRAEAFLREHRALLERRVSEGRIRDGHGDLHAENICVLEDRIVAYDALEFSPALRAGDVVCDLAFLTMDLDRRGFPAFARDLGRRYRHRTGDAELHELLPFYEDYRALVRAKVAALAATEDDATEERRTAKRREVRAYVHLACRRDLGPGLLCTTGLPASGKSTLATRAARALDAAYHASDVRRKQLAGLPPDARVRPGVDQGLYTPERRERTYASLRESAAEELAEGRRVVVDATFARAEERASFRELAAERGVPFFVLWVEADEAETRRRLADRAGDPRARSDADLEVWARARERYEPPTELEDAQVLRFESGACDPEQEVEALLERWLG